MIFQLKKLKTRMVQLPATAAIEYVAACWVSGAGRIFVRGVFCPEDFFPGRSFARGHFCPGGLLTGGAFVRGSFARGTFVRGAYARSPPQVQCVYVIRTV